MNTLQGIRIGNTVNCFINGKLHKKTFNTGETADNFFSLILNKKSNPTDDDINEILSFLNDNLRIALKCGLETDPNTGNVYMSGFNTPVPKTLIKIFEDYFEKKYPLISLENFWELLMINEDKRIRDTAFDFIQTHDFVVTDKGYMIVYKAVYIKDVYKSFKEYIVNQHTKVKKSWKKNPAKYTVYISVDNDELHITKKEVAEKWIKEKNNNVRILGNLDYMYNNELTNDDVIYTDMFSKKMTIKLGEPVKMDRGVCDADPQKDCSYGLHVGATKYVEKFANKDSVILVCLVNPANIVAVPDYDHSKMRVAEYLPIGIAERDENGINIIEQPFYENDYIQYEQNELVALLEKARKEEPMRNIPINGETEIRDYKELQKIIENRIISIS
jgi:hypothetical protein